MEKSGDYLIAVKGNQEKLKRQRFMLQPRRRWRNEPKCRPLRLDRSMAEEERRIYTVLQVPDDFASCFGQA